MMPARQRVIKKYILGVFGNGKVSSSRLNSPEVIVTGVNILNVVSLGIHELEEAGVRTYQCDDSKELHMFPALLLEVGDVVAILLQALRNLLNDKYLFV